MTLQELEAHKNRTVIFRGGRYILRGKRKIIDPKGRERIQVLLLDERTRISTCIARLEEVEIK